MTKTVRMFSAMTKEELEIAGGKGRVLAQLKQSGYPVPDGCVILTTAFAEGVITPESWAEVVSALQELRKEQRNATFAVRSSAMSEDSGIASFAGEFETILDVRTDDAVRRAIDAVMASLRSQRVSSYADAKGMDTSAHQMAVVVQIMVQADMAGVLFTAEPVSGDRNKLIGNYVHGSGDKLVSGEVDAISFSFARSSGRYEGPAELRPFAKTLHRLGCRLERELGGPQDIEWAVAQGKVHLLQSRPITTLQVRNAANGEWNDSLVGDHLWTNANVGEAVPDVMTPLTWSVLQDFHHRTAATMPDGLVASGNICGRPYLNLSLLISVYCAVGQKADDVLAREGALVGTIPEGMRVPIIPLNRWALLRSMIPQRLAIKKRLQEAKRDLPLYVSSSADLCYSLIQQIQECDRRDDLATIWGSALRQQWERSCWVLRHVTTEAASATARARDGLQKRIDPVEAQRILSVFGEGAELASLGPLLGLSRLSRGEMTRDEYLRSYGHRGVHEFEISIPRPSEDPSWLDNQLDQVGRAAVDAQTLLARQDANHEALWRQLASRGVRGLAGLRQLVARMGGAAQEREAVRSEMTRCMAVLRQFALRAGELLGIGDGVFFLELPELLGVLSGRAGLPQTIPARRETHRRYSELPPYPSLIRGRFDPIQWTADPARRSDFHDPTFPLGESAGKVIKGCPGASGRVEGVVRRLESESQGDQLQVGEILVTNTVNVGWTLLFPRAAAIITDVGAPLSHAAIVARELGIPAVVGCGNATTVLHTGDRVIVDGSRGVVELLS